MGDEQQASFDTIISKLISPPILAYADYSKPFSVHTDASSNDLGAVLYQLQEGKERVVAYTSRSLKQLERNYPAHKLEFLALKWAICEKFHDYLNGFKFKVVTDNNTLTYVFTTAKLDATGQRWVAALSDYDFSIMYRSGKKNADANGLSRIPEGNGKQNIIFPEVLKALCLSTTVSQENCPLVDSLAFTQTYKDAESVPESLLHAHALSSMDWRKAQRQNPTLKVIFDNLEVGSRVLLSRPRLIDVTSKNGKTTI